MMPLHTLQHWPFIPTTKTFDLPTRQMTSVWMKPSVLHKRHAASCRGSKCCRWGWTTRGMDMIPGGAGLRMRVSGNHIWWAYWLQLRTEPAVSPNTRHYSDFTHSCLEALQLQSFTVRHSAALWSYWNSRPLHASNKVPARDEGCTQIESEQFCVAGKPAIWQRRPAFFEPRGIRSRSSAPTWLARASGSNSNASHK